MVVCIIAAVVFGVMGIFSASSRDVAREAFRCTFRMIQLRPCDTDLERRLKSKIVVKFLRFPIAGKFIYKHFDLLSWIFVIAFFASIGGIIYGAYNYAFFGNCNGPSSTAPCWYGHVSE